MKAQTFLICFAVLLSLHIEHSPSFFDLPVHIFLFDQGKALRADRANSSEFHDTPNLPYRKHLPAVYSDGPAGPLRVGCLLSSHAF